MQGRSLVPLLRGETPADWRKSFYYQYYEYPVPHHVRPHYGVVTARYKLVRFESPDLDEWELFDLEQDPHELRNVYLDPAYVPTVVAELKRELERLRAELKVPAQPPREAYGNRAIGAELKRLSSGFALPLPASRKGSSGSHRLEFPVGERAPEPFGRAEAEVPQPDRADQELGDPDDSTMAASPVRLISPKRPKP